MPRRYGRSNNNYNNYRGGRGQNNYRGQKRKGLYSDENDRENKKGKLLNSEKNRGGGNYRGWHRGKRSGRGLGGYQNKNGKKKPEEKQGECFSASEMTSATTLNVETNSNNENKKRLARFIVNSGATEHFANSKFIFKSIDENRVNIIRCANKNEEANLKTEGVG